MDDVTAPPAGLGETRHPAADPAEHPDWHSERVHDLPPVVVAVDGSDASVRALVWAFRHAVTHGMPVIALTTWPLSGDVFARVRPGHVCEPRWQAREVQAQAVARALAAVAHPPAYDLHVDNAELVDALIRAGERASMVVIGSDGPADATPARRHTADRLRHEVDVPVVVVGPDGPLTRSVPEPDRHHGAR
jgi:nucleotide-binding universal stress UspA family protein